MPDFTIYQAPGVYVEEELTSIATVFGVRPGVMAIVGPGRGYREGSETITFEADDVELSKEGIDTDSVVVMSPDGTVLTLTTDYTLATADGVTTITRVDAGAIGAGESVFLTYQYTEDDYYDPFRVTDFADVQDAYGPALDIANSEIISPLSFAARFAFANGARELVLVATTGDIGAVDAVGLDAATDKLLGVEDVSVVVVLPDGMMDDGAGGLAELGTVAANLRDHCVEASANGNFRIGVVGYDKDADLSPTAVADSAASQRVVVAWPNRLNYFHGFNNQTIEVDGFYLAAAYAGRLISLPPQVPLTRKRIVGFSGIPASVAQTMTKSVKDDWSQNGVSVVEGNRLGQLVVRHGITTNISGIQHREISLVRARDALVNLLQTTMDSTELIGSFIDDDTPGKVKSIVAGVLEQAITQDTIIGYIDLKVRQLTGDPSVIEVKFQYQPAYPLNYIVISFSINTQTGETTILDQPQ